MVTDKDYPPNWVVMPGASLTAELITRKWTDKPVIEICGNREGIFSMGTLLLWVSLGSPYADSLSITGLPFVHSKSTLSLCVIVTMGGSDRHGKLIRTDKDQQFQWLIRDELLERDAVGLLDMAFTPKGYSPDHVHGSVSPDSEYELFFAKCGIG